VNDSSSEPDLLNDLAHEFAERYRRGERPALTEYTSRYPELAAEIRELFPAMALMEQFGTVDGPATGPQCRAATEDGSPLRQLGEYRILREIARGGMGIVYEAVQESLGRHVALKVLPFQGMLNPNYLERFQREARAAAHLHHTNIVPVFGVGQDSGVHYFAMQFIQGQSLDSVLHELRRLRHKEARSEQDESPRSPSRPGNLDQALSIAQGLLTGQFPQAGVPAAEAGAERSPTVVAANQGALAPRSPDGNSGEHTSSTSGILNQPEAQYYRSVAQVGIQVAEALTYAHQQGILHRDIKPANLLLDTRGTVWVTDFGLAKAEGADQLTTPGDIVGTIRYMAPERFRGHGDQRSDVYSLGLTLYELATLRPAFTASERAQLIERMLHQDPPRPSKVSALIPRDLETIILKAMAKDPGQRYPSAAALAEDLRRFLADRPVRARRTAAWEQLWRWCRRNPAVASLAAAVVVLLVAVTVVSSLSALWLRQEEQATRRQLDLTVQAEKKTHHQLGLTLQAEKKAQRQLGLTEQAEMKAQRRLFKALLAQARASRMTRRPGQRFAGLRAIREALKLPLPPGRSLDELRNEAIACLLLPDFEVAKEWNGWPVGSTGLTFDPKFERYARGDKDGNVTVRRVVDDRKLLTLPGAGPVSSYGGLAFSPDGRFLHQRCQTPGGWRSRLWKLDGLRPVSLLDDDHSGFAFRPDGRECVAYYPGGSLRVYDTASGKERRRWRLDFPGDVAHLSWNPRRPLLLAYENAVWVVNAQTGRIEWKVPMAGVSSWADWHPRGRVLAVGSNADRKIRLWDMDTQQLVLPPLEGHKSEGFVLRFSPCGERLLSTDWSGICRLWDVQTGRQLLAVPAGATSLQFNPAGTLAAVEASSPRLRLFRYQSGLEFRTLIPQRGPQRDAAGFWAWAGGTALDPQGRLLAVSVQSGSAFLDLVSGEEVGLLLLPGNSPLAFEPSGALLTKGSAGLLRWPVTAEAHTRQRRYGPPEQLYPQTNHDCHGASADCRVLAIPLPHSDQGAIVLHRNSKRIVPVGPQQDVRNCAVSPDRRWVATGSHSLWEGAGAKVWDARTGKHVANLPVPGLCPVHFSPDGPDGKWLATGGGGVRLWRVGTWRPGAVVSSSGSQTFAFAPDGRLLAVRDDPGIVRLIRVGTGKELARLTAPVECRLNPWGFTPDGTRLITLGEDRAVHVFDLAAIRRQLRELGLDWDLPPYRPGAAGSGDPRRAQGSGDPRRALKELPPLQVGVDLGTLAPEEPQKAIVKYSLAIAFMRLNPEAYLRRGRAYYQLKQYRQAADDLGMALALNPSNKDSQIWFELGYACGDCGRPKRAIAAYTRCLALNPKHQAAWNNRGGQRQKLGQFPEAVADFSQAVKLNPKAHIALNNRSLLYSKLGQWDKAAADYSRLIDLARDRNQLAGFYYLRAVAYGHLARHREALADWTKLIELAPGDWVAQNGLARFLATCPDARLRNPARAIQLAEGVLQVEEQVGLEWKWNTLGVAHYRAGHWKAAIDCLEKSRVLRNGGDAFDFFFLAMAHWKQGREKEARQWYERASGWLEQNQQALAKDKPRQEELRRFRAEAAQLLGIKEKKD
jgi:serine/threonine protein kinase/tetratricopeptide (TPR) repeat protein/WD40 repeat protein